MRRKKEPHENKRRGLSLKPLIIGMSACVVLLGGVLLWAVLGSVRLEPESGHGLGIVDAVNTMGLQKKTQELAAKPSAASSESQTLTANETDAEEITRSEVVDTYSATRARETDAVNNGTSKKDTGTRQSHRQKKVRHLQRMKQMLKKLRII